MVPLLKKKEATRRQNKGLTIFTDIQSNDVSPIIVNDLHSIEHRVYCKPKEKSAFLQTAGVYYEPSRLRGL